MARRHVATGLLATAVGAALVSALPMGSASAESGSRICGSVFKKSADAPADAPPYALLLAEVSKYDSDSVNDGTPYCERVRDEGSVPGYGEKVRTFSYDDTCEDVSTYIHWDKYEGTLPAGYTPYDICFSMPGQDEMTHYVVKFSDTASRDFARL